MPTRLASLLSASLSLAACGGSSTPPAVTPDTPSPASSVAGAWQTPCVPMSATQHMQLHFDNTAQAWAMDFMVFGDATCAAKFLTVHVEGPYELGAPSQTVAGATEARFGFTTKSITPHSAMAAGYLASASGCNRADFAEGTATDITTTGCPALGQYPIADCPADFDLVRADATSLTFGARPTDNNLCTVAKRPTALSPLSAARR